MTLTRLAERSDSACQHGSPPEGDLSFNSQYAFIILYRSDSSDNIGLGQNLEILRSLAESNAASSKGHNAIKKTNMNNMLMQLRK